MLSPRDTLELPKNIIFRFFKPLQQIVCVCLSSYLFTVTHFNLLLARCLCNSDFCKYRFSYYAWGVVSVQPPQNSCYIYKNSSSTICACVVYCTALSYSQATAGMSQPQLSAHYHGLPRRPSIPADQTPVPHPTACREQQFNPPFHPHSTPCQADLWWVTGQAWEKIKRLKDLDFDHLTWKGGLWELDFTIHCITSLNKSMLVLSVFTDFWWCNAEVWISLEKHC